MPIYLGAGKDSQRTTVSIEEVREFVSGLADKNEQLRKARAELKDALLEDEVIDGIAKVIQLEKEKLKTYLDSSGVYKTYLDKVEELKEEKQQFIADAKDNGIPKKEIDTAIKMLKADIDPDSTSEIYTNIADLVTPSASQQ